MRATTPGANDSVTTSAQRTSDSITGRASGCARSSVMQSLPAFAPCTERAVLGPRHVRLVRRDRADRVEAARRLDVHDGGAVVGEHARRAPARRAPRTGRASSRRRAGARAARRAPASERAARALGTGSRRCARRAAAPRGRSGSATSARSARTAPGSGRARRARRARARAGSRARGSARAPRARRRSAYGATSSLRATASRRISRFVRAANSRSSAASSGAQCSGSTWPKQAADPVAAPVLAGEARVLDTAAPRRATQPAASGTAPSRAGSPARGSPSRRASRSGAA